MIWHSKADLERLGPPLRKDILWVSMVIIPLMAQLGAEIIRLVDAFNGKPLIISKVLGISITWGASPVQYVLGWVFHLVLLALLALGLWGCSLWLQQWAYFRRR